MTTYTQWQNQTPLPRNESRLLIQTVENWPHSQVVIRSHDPIPPAHLRQLNALAQRRIAGEPMAYIIGSRAFYGRDFHISPAVLIPRPETELLVETAIQLLPPKGTIWDLGTGSGIIAISIALERPDATVYASDISQYALAIARHNAAHLGAHIQLAQGSWFNALPDLNDCDILASNPPYIHAGDSHLQQGDLRFEPQHALTDHADGLQHIRHLIRHASGSLKRGGHLIIEHGYDQAATIRQLFAQHDFGDITTLRDLANHERLTFGRLG